MAEHNELGKLGEQLAGEYLAERGYSILHRNWRYGRYELDIIALKGRVLHFVEVKTRASNVDDFPEENVNRKKIRHLLKAADESFTSTPTTTTSNSTCWPSTNGRTNPPNTCYWKTFTFDPKHVNL